MTDLKTILVIEDEADFREILAEFFRDKYDRVLMACNGVEGLDICQAETVSIILSDLMMPKMMGDDFLQRLRAAGSMTPVVFLSGNSDKELALTALRLGAGDVLDKPIDLDRIASCLDRVLEIHRREKLFNNSDDHETQEKNRKMVGLLRAVNSKKNKQTG